MNRFCRYFIQAIECLIGIVCLVICWPLLFIFLYVIKHSKSTWGGDFLSDEQLKEREALRKKEIMEHAISI